jgi:hypothetical protein
MNRWSLAVGRRVFYGIFDVAERFRPSTNDICHPISISFANFVNRKAKSCYKAPLELELIRIWRFYAKV